MNMNVAEGTKQAQKVPPLPIQKMSRYRSSFGPLRDSQELLHSPTTLKTNELSQPNQNTLPSAMQYTIAPARRLTMTRGQSERKIPTLSKQTTVENLMRRHESSRERRPRLRRMQTFSSNFMFESGPRLSAERLEGRPSLFS